MAVASPAATFTIIKRFNGTNGGGLVAPPVEGLDGNLYGATQNGGVYNYGTIFKLTPGLKLSKVDPIVKTNFGRQ
jgi:uncharacterized repeat protein (TIGR03803 family)